MTQRDFVAIAAAINDHRWIAADQRDLDLIAHAIAEHCATVNPRFDRARFLTACGVES